MAVSSASLASASLPAAVSALASLIFCLAASLRATWSEERALLVVSSSHSGSCFLMKSSASVKRLAEVSVCSLRLSSPSILRRAGGGGGGGGTCWVTVGVTGGV